MMRKGGGENTGEVIYDALETEAVRGSWLCTYWLLQVSEFICYASSIAGLLPEGHTAVIQRAASTSGACRGEGDRGKEGMRGEMRMQEEGWQRGMSGVNTKGEAKGRQVGIMETERGRTKTENKTSINHSDLIRNLFSFLSITHHQTLISNPISSALVSRTRAFIYSIYTGCTSCVQTTVAYSGMQQLSCDRCQALKKWSQNTRTTQHPPTSPCTSYTGVQHHTFPAVDLFRVHFTHHPAAPAQVLDILRKTPTAQNISHITHKPFAISFPPSLSFAQ